jgi:hypothetical protein
VSGNLAELTRHDGRRIGIPKTSALLIVGIAAPGDDMPKAKTMIRWSTDLAGAQHAFVRDELRQVRNLIPAAYSGLHWTEVQAANGDVVLIPEGSAQGGYEETGDDEFTITLNIPTGPVSFPIKATFDQVRTLAGLGAPDPGGEADPAPAKPKRRPRSKAAG